VADGLDWFGRGEEYSGLGLGVRRVEGEGAEGRVRLLVAEVDPIALHL
jgi:hypothetical protein